MSARAVQVPRLSATTKVFESVNSSRPALDAITVAVSLYNYENFIGDCLDSIAQQEHPSLELVVVDYASPGDDSVGVAARWMEANHRRFGRATLLSHVHNQGLAEARNTAFEYARTEPVFVIDADNLIYPRALASLYRLVRYEGYDAAYSQLEWFGDIRRLGFSDLWEKERIRYGNHIDAMALISRDSWSRVGGYTHIEGGWEDFDFWCKMMDHGMRAAYLPEILCRYRVHGESMIETATNDAEDRLIVELTMRHPWLAMKTRDPKKKRIR